MRGADALVEGLIQHGVSHIFGVPGDTSMAFHDALRLRSEEIIHVLCRDERHAAYAADAYARITGKLGVVEVPSGGGALYVVPGLSEANVSNIPLLCIASEISMGSEATYALTDCNQEQLFSAVTKWNAKVKSSNLLPHFLRRAVRLACSGFSGATALTVPENVLREAYSGKIEDLYPSLTGAGFTPYRNEPDQLEVDASADLLYNAHRPLVLAGGGVHLSGAYEALKTLVETYKLPLISSVDGKGSVSEYGELVLGTVGANGGSEEANVFAKEADVVLVLGCKMDNVTTFGRKLIHPDARVIQVDLSEEILGNNARLAIPIMADLRAFLTALNQRLALKGYQGASADWQAFARNKRQEKMGRIQGEQERKAEGVIVAKLIGQLEKQFDESTIYTGDAGNPTPYIASYLKAKVAGKKTVLPRGHGALGYALSAAIGAQIAAPESRVIALFGDGSFGMAMGEMETAKRLSLPIIFVHLQNDCYGWIKTIQRLYYKSAYYGVDFSAIEGVAIAEGFGIKARCIRTDEEIEAALAWAKSHHEEPVLLNVMIESIETFVPPVCQWERDLCLPEEQRKKLVY